MCFMEDIDKELFELLLKIADSDKSRDFTGILDEYDIVVARVHHVITSDMNYKEYLKPKVYSACVLVEYSDDITEINPIVEVGESKGLRRIIAECLDNNRLRRQLYYYKDLDFSTKSTIISALKRKL